MSKHIYNEPVLLVCMKTEAFKTPVNKQTLSFIEENTFYIPALVTDSQELDDELKKNDLVLISVIPRSLIKMQNDIIDEFTEEIKKQEAEEHKE
jgi:hypothetical protein